MPGHGRGTWDLRPYPPRRIGVQRSAMAEFLASSSPDSTGPSVPRRVSGSHRLLAALGGMAVVVVAACGGSQDDDAAADTAAQAASIQVGCARWLATEPSEAGNVGWCSSMARSMSDDAADRGAGAVWGDPDALRASCREWMSAEPPGDKPASVDPRGWCDDMVGWMRAHPGSWSGRSDWTDWMMHGPERRGHHGVTSGTPTVPGPGPAEPGPPSDAPGPPPGCGFGQHCGEPERGHGPGEHPGGPGR